MLQTLVLALELSEQNGKQFHIFVYGKGMGLINNTIVTGMSSVPTHSKLSLFFFTSSALLAGCC